MPPGPIMTPGVALACLTMPTIFTSYTCVPTRTFMTVPTPALKYLALPLPSTPSMAEEEAISGQIPSFSS